MGNPARGQSKKVKMTEFWKGFFAGWLIIAPIGFWLGYLWTKSLNIGKDDRLSFEDSAKKRMKAGVDVG